MSKKGGRESNKSTENDGPASPPGTAVDFLFRTMIERESAPGKRRIRPKNVEELLQSDIQELGSDEDPDFEVTKDKHHNESDVSINSDDEDSDMKGSEEESVGKKGLGGVGGGNGEEDSDEDDDSYNANFDEDGSTGTDDSMNCGNSSGEEDSSEDEDDGSGSPVQQKKSALRDTLQKLNDTEFTPQRKKRRKKPKKAVTGSTSAAVAAATSNGKGKSSGTASKKSGESVGGGQKKRSKSNVSSKSNKAGEKSKADDSSKAGTVSKKRKRVVTSKNKMRIKDELRSNRKKKKSDYSSISDLIASAERSQKENRKEIDLGNPICSACLGSKSDGSNEIVECDSCGISVHEVCYGVSDTLSVSSGSGSSCSTEPWFCDACKTGAKSISCELCPMKGGLFKETSVGRWVHLVCGLYTRQVIIDENGLISLSGIPYSKWGAHACSVCENDRYARTGICIPCDAGMCKAFLHVTCAQKHGLLSDPVVENPGGPETAEADPYYAACKLHTNRETAKRRAKSCGILQEQLRLKREKKLSENLSPQERYNQNRIRRKLERIRFKVAIKQAHSYSPHPSSLKSSSSSFPLGASGTNSSSSFGNLASYSTIASGFLAAANASREELKKSRLLSTAAGVTGSFVRKAELMGLDLKALELEDKNTRIVANVKRKWNVLPSLGVEFAAYYADRELRINKMSHQCDKLEKENNELNDVQISLQCSYDTQCVNHQAMHEDTDKVREQLCGLSGIVKGLCPYGNKKLASSLSGFVRTDLPGVRRRSLSHSAAKTSGSGGRASPSKSGLKKNKRSKLPLSPTAVPGRLAIAQCFLCKKSDDQHLITRCDHCKKHYHLRCLDPPLSRMPKRSRLCGWMCSDCGEEEPEVEESHVDTEAPRSLRGRTKIRKPGKYRHSTESDDDELKILGVTPATDKRPSSTQVSIALTELKIEPGAPPILTNGTAKPPSKRRKSGTSSTASSSSKLVNISLSSPPVTLSSEMLMQTTPQSHSQQVTLPTKKESPVSPFKTPSPLKSPADRKQGVVNNSEEKMPKSKKRPKKVQEISNESTPTLSKIKKERKRKEKKPKDAAVGGGTEVQVGVVASSTITATEKDSKVTPNRKAKPGSPAKDKKVTPTPKSPKDVVDTPRPVKKSKSKSITPSKVDVADNTAAGGESKPKKKRKSRAKIKTLVEGTPGNTAEISGNISSSINKAVFGTTLGLGDGGNRTDGIVNGTPATKPTVKRRKSSGVSVAAGVLVGGNPPEKLIPPKKRKRIAVTSTPQELTHQLAIIDAVANGIFDGELGDKNGGISRNSNNPHDDAASGVIMQGIAPQWINKGDEDHNIMKGHAMGSNSRDDEIVTVNASDLFDYVANSTIATTTCTYTPGFYSSPSATTSLNYGSSQVQLSHHEAPSAANKYNSSNQDGLNLNSTSSSSMSMPMSSPWTPQPQESQNQNVIKLHYESDSVVNVPSYSALSQSYTAPPSTVSSIDGKCWTCKKEDSKKFMVTCDKCAQDFHFMCLNPPLKYSPRRRGYSWYCIGCDDDSSTASGQENGINSP